MSKTRRCSLWGVVDRLSRCVGSLSLGWWVRHCIFAFALILFFPSFSSYFFIGFSYLASVLPSHGHGRGNRGDRKKVKGTGRGGKGRDAAGQKKAMKEYLSPVVQLRKKKLWAKVNQSSIGLGTWDLNGSCDPISVDAHLESRKGKK